MRKHTKALVVALMAVVAAIGASGCVPDASADAAVPVVAQGATAPAQACDGGTCSDAGEDLCRQVFRVVVFQDKSGSANQNRTPQITLEDLEPLIERVILCGGELAVGVIDERSNEALVRLYVEPPASPPAEPLLEGTPFEVAAERRRADEEHAEHDRAVRAHRVRAEDDAETFREGVGRILAVDAEAERTDVWGAIARSGHFLGEPWPGPQPVRLVAIVVSDANNNVAAPSRPLPPGAELILVNGTPSLGALGELGPTRFEGFPASLRYLLGR